MGARRMAARTSIALLLALSLVLLVGSVAYGSPNGGATRQRGLKGTSLNWSGYAVETSLASPENNAATDVIGNWVVPAVTGTGKNAYSSVWVGLDGYSDSTVEQLGTEQDWIGGRASYYAWWEMYPAGSILITSIHPHPGDVMTAEVRHTDTGSFILSMTDVTTGESFTTVQAGGNAKLQSAEWVVEAPSSGRILPLANFGTATITNGYATLLGVHGPIGQFAYDPITMATRQGVVKASVSGLLSGGTSFTDTWHHQ